jgi:hypothetical protein
MREVKKRAHSVEIPKLSVALFYNDLESDEI